MLVYSLNEWIPLLTGTFRYDHGWTLPYSAPFNVGLFLLLRLHFGHPLLAYAVSAACFLALLLADVVPVR
ncbi:hypothetical protein SAMN02799624_02203 [Paenibacillus sp. UNC496MF]|uniref:hypothetical protein n=1 Tax=Paenibacillus sp. UNC496MF TaxID=1502753 RepID=UPI0008F0A0CB|nr:hypothetical protein [Paenibacillus sp. UNC496MF]SFI79064.1 hypothetical protein SAMN02799624_02203 [Paenibacillus sp. UNC496MF]